MIERLLIVWSVAFVLLRAAMLGKFFGVGVVSLVFGLVELWGLIVTARGLRVGSVAGNDWRGFAVPVFYLLPLLLSPVGESSQVGVLVFVLGVLLQLCFRFWMGWRLSVGVPVFIKLLSSGPWAIVRHPLAASEVVMVAGFVLLHLSPWNVAVGFVCVAGFAANVLVEESMLRRVSDYGDYADRVRWRWLPGLW